MRRAADLLFAYDGWGKRDQLNAESLIRDLLHICDGADLTITQLRSSLDAALLEQQKLRDTIAADRRIHERELADMAAERDRFRWNADLATRDENQRLRDENARLEGSAIHGWSEVDHQRGHKEEYIAMLDASESKLAILSSSLEGIAGEMERYAAGEMNAMADIADSASAYWATKLRTLLSSITQQTEKTDKSKS